MRSNTTLENNFTNSAYTNILSKIKNRKVRVGVVGVGYVGQALVEALLAERFETVGFDLNESKLASINHPLFSPTTSVTNLSKCEVICICVPTPVDEDRRPDISDLEKASFDIARLEKKERLVVVESTVSPGTLRKKVLPIFEKALWKGGNNLFLAISPERIDPGNKSFTLKNTPKIVGGIDERSTRLAVELYSAIVEKVVPTTTPEIAEFSKMLENTYRLVNISLINQIKGYADAAGIDIWEAIEAASTKPFAFMAHYPGPGVGGHCIPVDPVYLLEEAKNYGINLGMVEEAVRINEEQPKKVISEAKKKLNGHTAGRAPKMLLLGIAYKPGTADTRESPAIKIIHEAEKEGFEVSYFDPYVPKLNGYNSRFLTRELLEEQDVVVIATHHANIPYELIVNLDKPVIDTRNILRSYHQSVLNPNGEYT
ncbi:MAG: nucleotide sugar dehydrogenase [Candidatus Woykebacteria bacterium]